MGAPTRSRLTPLPDAPLVTIVTPSLNTSGFIGRALASVAEQGYPAIEHIVVDGGSTDGTEAIVRGFPGVRWISEPDEGQAAAINKGFRLASGEVVAWINSDDYYLPGAVAGAVAALRADPGCGMVYAGWVVVDEHGRELGRHVPPDWDLRQEIERGNFVPQQTTFFRREALEQVGLLDERYHFALDYDLFIRVGKRFDVRRADGQWAAFRLRPGSKTVDQTDRFYREEREISRRHGAPWLSEHLIAHALGRLRAPARSFPVAWQAAALLRRGDLPGLARRALRVAARAAHRRRTPR